MNGVREFIKYVYEHTENAPNHFPNKCPECGRFMKYGVETFPDGATLDRFWLCKCGHEEKVNP